MIQTQEEIAQFIKEHSPFKALSEPAVAAVAPLLEPIYCGPGQVIFHQGSEPDALYIILDGSVEVVEEGNPPKIIGYQAKGDLLGHIALIHDCKHAQSVRVPEEAILLKLKRQSFDDLQTYYPDITNSIKDLINRRFADKQLANLPGLQGNLAFFDLPTVVQTLLGSRQDGILRLSGRAGKPLAEVGVRNGKIVQAAFMHLTSESAFYELLTRNEPLNFIFIQHKESDGTVNIDKNLSTKEPYQLLMEAARRADELPQLLKRWQWPSGAPIAAVKHPDWTKLTKQSGIIAHKIWLLIEVGLNVKQLSHKLPYDRYTLLSILDEMHTCGLLGEQNRQQVHEVITSPIPLIDAFNLVVSSLSVIFGKEWISWVLKKSLAESVKAYPELADLKVHAQTATLDVHSIDAKFTKAKSCRQALEHLTLTLLRLTGQNKPNQSQLN